MLRPVGDWADAGPPIPVPARSGAMYCSAVAVTARFYSYMDEGIYCSVLLAISLYSGVCYDLMLMSDSISSSSLNGLFGDFGRELSSGFASYFSGTVARLCSIFFLYSAICYCTEVRAAFVSGAPDLAAFSFALLSVISKIIQLL